MNYGADAADQIVKYSLDGLDHGLRLSGTLAKNLAVFFAAVLKDNKKTYGKTRLARMLREGKSYKFFTIPTDRLKEFAREGKKRGLLYVVIKDKNNPQQCELMVFAEDAAKVNRVMDKMNLDFLRSESAEAVQEVLTEQEKENPVQTESVTMPEGEVQFELDEELSFAEPETEPGNFMGAQEGMERNPSDPSLRSSGISGQENIEDEKKPSVKKELQEIKKEQEKQRGRKKQEKDPHVYTRRKKKKRKKGRGRWI